jgi:hypothetical protein
MSYEPRAHTILIENASDPGNESCSHKDTVRWRNDSDYDVTSFTLPDCVTPTTSFDTLSPGATSRDYTIPEGVDEGDYGYSFTLDDPQLDPRSGTINVGSGTE